jgi:carbon storage regulator CsrA
VTGGTVSPIKDYVRRIDRWPKPLSEGDAMLILSRKVGEKIAIGDNVTIIINRISGNRVALGIQAPKNIRVVRGELERFADEFRDDAADEDASFSRVPPPTVEFDDAATTFMPRNAR